MRVWTCATAAVAALAIAVSPAYGQNLSLRGPAWAQPLLATDVTPTTGGRAMLNAEGIEAAARVTVAPHAGGVARVIRFEARSDGTSLSLRRFTGHPSTGWWLWGADTPRITTLTAALREELTGLVRGAIGVGSMSGGDSTQSCPSGEQAFVELALGGRSTSVTRACVGANDPIGRLVTRISELAGSRTEEELAAAGLEEVMEADRAFAAMARAEGAPAAFARYAAEDAIMFGGTEAVQGREAVAGLFSGWPQGQRLEWAPVAGGVSTRGDMGWTWGRATLTRADGATPTCYVSIWKRDWEGNWRFALDAGITNCARAAAGR